MPTVSLQPGAGAPEQGTTTPCAADMRSPASKGSTGVSLRAILMGLVAVAVVCPIVSYAELVTKQIQIGYLQMPPVVVALLFFLFIGSRHGPLLRSRYRLTAQEMMTIYTMMLMATMVTSRGLLEKVLPVMLAPNYFASQANGWQKLFYPYTKRWMVPWDPAGPIGQPVTRTYYEGLRPGQTIPWEAWILPLAAWGVLALALFFGFLCMAAIVRRQWTDNERLSFPLVQLPLEMARNGDQFISNRLMWAGFIVPTAVFMLNGIHNMYPSAPMLPLRIDLNQALTQPPYSGMFMTPLLISFAAIGFFYFLPADLLFSLWFFFMLGRLEDIVAASYNARLDEMPLYPARVYVGFQAIGAYIVLACYLVWAARPHLRKVWKAVIRRGPSDRREMLPYPVAFWGLVGSTIVCAAWFHMAGLSWGMAALEVAVFMFVTALVLARSVAECGVVMTEASFRPIDVYSVFAARHTLGPANLTALGFLDAAILRDQRGLLLTGYLDGLRIADGVNIRRRAFLPVFALSIVAAMVLGAFLQISLGYHRGGLTLWGGDSGGEALWAFQAHAPAMRGSVAYDLRAPLFTAVGMVVALFLVIMRATFAWWPLHPMGYALCGSWTMIVFWFPCLIAWMVKSLVARYGGMRTCTLLRPFFLGLVLGEFSMAVFWTVMAAALNITAPFFPWT